MSHKSGKDILEYCKSLAPVGIRSTECPTRSPVAITYVIARPPERDGAAVKVIVQLGDD